ncbi:MAG: efflux RND transporter periplasmic adaptor subunit [Prevotellaceae bacterium]|jgi:cobalt-zinc-cadmium efflux system membrane fusion protein|nr:efflux RND transporter periplasmic adaptor subunit [Prevotellaceae bacterium]
MNKLKQFALFLIAISAAACGTSPTPETENTESKFSQVFLDNIETAIVTMENIQQELRLTGKALCDPDLLVQYIPLVSGVVVSSSFSLGDKVSKGQSIALMRSAELSDLYAEKQNLETEVKILARQLESSQSMYRDNLLSQKELLEDQGRLNQAQAELTKVNNTLALYGNPNDDGTFSIKAPNSGFIISKNMAPGMPVATESGPLFSIADISRVWIVANVYASNLAFVKEGMKAEITTPAYPGVIFHGSIDAIPHIFDPEEHVVKARIIMPNNDFKLKPEMVVDITLKEQQAVKMAAIPSKALLFDNNRYYVVKQVVENFVINEVKLHLQTGNTSYIASGLEEGEEVVVKNNLLMYSKLKE